MVDHLGQNYTQVEKGSRREWPDSQVWVNDPSCGLLSPGSVKEPGLKHCKSGCSREEGSDCYRWRMEFYSRQGPLCSPG